MGLDLGIRGGLSAREMARDLQKYLQHPDMLFRRVRDEHGLLHLSRRAADFHPGQGVYRSSYKNALRLAATETNIAYNTADHLRWQQMDFVVGIEVHLSGNHSFKGRDGKHHELHDICDELAGKYPKDFKFTGWHPNCRCYATTILKSEKEMDEELDARLAGKRPPTGSRNEVKDVPDNFKQWTVANAKRIKAATENGTLPYFLRDNRKHVSSIVSFSNEVNKSRHLGVHGNLKHKETKQRELLNDIPMRQLDPSPQTREYTHNQAKRIGAKMVDPMNYNDADRKNANISGDKENCQSAVVAFFARLLGMNVTSVRYDSGIDFIKKLENNQCLAYYMSPTNKVNPPQPRKLMSADEVMNFIEKETAKEGIYNIAINKWENKSYGHIMCLIKHKDKSYVVDIQDGSRADLEQELKRVSFETLSNDEIHGVEILRIDKLVLSDDAMKVLLPIN